MTNEDDVRRVLGEPELKEEPGMRKYFGAMPGGGLLNVYHFEPDAFGVIGARPVLRLLHDLKKERKRSFRAVDSMLRAFKLVNGKERVISIAPGCDSLGNEILVVVTINGGPNAQVPNNRSDSE